MTCKNALAICIVSCIAIATFSGCVHAAFPKSTAVPQPPSSVVLPALGEPETVVAKAMEQDVVALAQAAGRCVGTAGHEQAKAYIVSRLKELGLKPYAGSSFELPYTAEGQNFVNIAAVIPGKNPKATPLLLNAHYDTCGERPGADDNAAAIAVLLVVAKTLRASELERSVVFLFPDGEEPPHFLTPAMGSTWFYEHQRRSDFHCALVLDLVGHDVPLDGLEDVMFLTGVESDPGLAKALQQVKSGPGMRALPTLNRYVGDLSDHHVHRLNKRPYLFFSCAQWQYYHKKTDTPEHLNYAKMARLADFLTRLMPVLDARPLTGPFEGYDTTAMELQYIRQTINPRAAQATIRLETREDIDNFARMLLISLALARL